MNTDDDNAMERGPDRALTLLLLEDAIATGNIELSARAFAYKATLTPDIQTDLLERVLNAPAFDQQAFTIRGDKAALRPFMATDAESYETALAHIAGQLCRSANLNLPDFDLVKEIALAEGQAPYRTRAALALIKETVTQNTAWRPDIAGIFAEIGVEKGETVEQVRAYRQNKADRINSIGEGVTSWLQETPSVAMRMSAVDQNWWRERHWHTDPEQMPWANATRLQAEAKLMKQVCAELFPFMEERDPHAELRAREITGGLIGRLNSGKTPGCS